jgi:hypothetical protein
MASISITIEAISNGFLVTFGQSWTTTPGKPGSPTRFYAPDEAGVLALISQRLAGDTSAKEPAPC